MSVFPVEIDSSGPRLAAHLFFFSELSSTEQGLICVSDTCGVENLCKSSQTFEVRLGAL